jgi:DNA repair protein RAD5
MIDCPEVLHSGADLIVSLSVYIRISAFQPSNFSHPSVEDAHQVIFNGGQETYDEQALRERKTSLLRLFDAVGLKPRSGNDFTKKKSDAELREEIRKRMAQRDGNNSKKTEIVGDGEEVVTDDGEELSDNELSMIYKRYLVSIIKVKITSNMHSFQSPRK